MQAIKQWSWNIIRIFNIYLVVKPQILWKSYAYNIIK